MTEILEVIVPRRAGNEYRGGAIALYGFCFLVAEQLFSATVHFLTPDGGKNTIASIIVFEGDPDPTPIAHMFASIAGMHEMLFVLLYGIVLWRYRSLVPLMLALMLLGMVFGFVVTAMHPLTPEYFERTPPAMLVRGPKLLLIGGLFLLAVRKAAEEPA